jgi:hypothetical protein
MNTSGTNDIPTLQYNGRFLHSPRNPLKEARRIVERQLADSLRRFSRERPITLFFLDPGLGYAALAARELYPESRIHFAYSDRGLYEAAIAGMPETVRETEPSIRLFESPGEFRAHILTVLGEPDFLSAAVLDWPASSFLPDHYRLTGEFLEAFTELQKGFATRSFFGMRWIKNCRANRRWETVSLPFPRMDTPAVLCASGPGLADSINIIRSLGRRVRLWALPSALKILNAAGLTPDAVVSTDGGYWAGTHLRGLGADTHLFIARSAMLPPSLADRLENISLFSLGMPFETPLYPDTGKPASHRQRLFRLPERGSVIFTALDILGLCGAPSVLLLGADFSTRGLASHSRPHSFDPYLESSSDRLHPLTTERWMRSRGEDLEVYASWLAASGISRRWPRILRHSPDGAELPVRNYLREEQLFEPAPADGAPVFPGDDGIVSDAGEMADPMSDLRGLLSHSLPEDLFSNPERRNIISRLIYADGIEVKNCYFAWMGGEDEGVAIATLRKRLNSRLEYARS